MLHKDRLFVLKMQFSRIWRPENLLFYSIDSGGQNFQGQDICLQKLLFPQPHQNQMVVPLVHILFLNTCYLI